MRFRASLMAAAVSAVAGLTGCAVNPQPLPTAQGAFTEMVAPPETPPPLTIQDLSINPGYYSWIIDGDDVVFRTEENQDDAVLPEVSVKGASLRIDVGSSVVPAEFIVVIFDELNSTGLPSEPLGEEFNCLADTGPCQLRSTDPFVSANVNLPASTKIVVVHLSYASEDSEDAIRLLSGSWAVRIGED
ncbi:hypothetical protein ACFQ58_14110 [Agromyces sp. NPDC056523]|uniref:hypothetical protein n=1 Tax=Agromyces sp. NPDC056523 TaxID=3345850 RepID=UPI00366C19E4